jgi:hypothetical protein
MESGPHKADSEPSEHQIGLNVLCRPFSHAAPDMVKGLASSPNILAVAVRQTRILKP